MFYIQFNQKDFINFKKELLFSSKDFHISLSIGFNGLYQGKFVKKISITK